MSAAVRHVLSAVSCERGSRYLERFDHGRLHGQLRPGAAVGELHDVLQLERRRPALRRHRERQRLPRVSLRRRNKLDSGEQRRLRQLQQHQSFQHGRLQQQPLCGHAQHLRRMRGVELRRLLLDQADTPGWLHHCQQRRRQRHGGLRLEPLRRYRERPRLGWERVPGVAQHRGFPLGAGQHLRVRQRQQHQDIVSAVVLRPPPRGNEEHGRRL